MAGKKGKSGRRRDVALRLRIYLALRRGRDDDLIAFFESIPVERLAASVKAALRGGMQAGQSAAASNEDAETAVWLDGLGSELD